MAEAVVLTPPGAPEVESPKRLTEDYAGDDATAEEVAPPAVRQRPRLQHRISRHTQKLNESSKEWLRAGVFGGMDGLSSTVGILAATAALPTATVPILLATGASAGIAGAASMGAGEYVSVKTDNERLFRAIDQVKRNHEANPAQAHAELAELLVDQVGLYPEEAQI
ncbi:MAG: VIT1/CCC1 transporter family protein, partial [Terriglobales bacterium]